MAKGKPKPRKSQDSSATPPGYVGTEPPSPPPRRLWLLIVAATALAVWLVALAYMALGT